MYKIPTYRFYNDSTLKFDLILYCVIDRRVGNKMTEQTNMLSKKDDLSVVSMLYASKVVQGWQVIIYTSNEFVAKTACDTVQIKIMRNKKHTQGQFFQKIYTICEPSISVYFLSYQFV